MKMNQICSGNEKQFNVAEFRVCVCGTALGQITEGFECMHWC